MKKNKSAQIAYTVSSGNIYADFGFPNPEEAQAKSKLAMAITQAIKDKKLNPQQAAKRLGIDSSEISKITRGFLSGFTIEELVQFLSKCSQ